MKIILFFVLLVVSLISSQTQSPCTAGMFNGGSGVCKPCEAGSFSASGGEFCETCPKHQFADTTGSSACKKYEF